MSPSPYPLHHQFNSDDFHPIAIYNCLSMGNTHPIITECKGILFQLAVDLLIERTSDELFNGMEIHLTKLTLTLLTVEYSMNTSPAYYYFIAIEIYICMISMMMLSITIEVRVNIGLSSKGRPQAWLGHSLFRSFYGNFRNFRY